MLKSTDPPSTGCSGLSTQLVPDTSSATGARESSPPNEASLLTSSGSETKAPSLVSSTLPQSSSDTLTLPPDPQGVTSLSSGPSTVVHSGSEAFRLTASLTKQDAPPHGHWYACTSKGYPSYTPRTSVKTPTPWYE